MDNQTNFKSAKFKGAIQLFKESWQIYRSKLRVLIGIAVIPIGSLLLIRVLVLFWSLYLPQQLYKAWYLPLGIYLVYLFLLTWMIPALLLALRENLGIVESYKKGLKYLLSYIWIYFLLSVIVLGGYGFLIVPGIIFSVWFSLAVYALIFEDKKGMPALLRSKQLVSGRWWGVFWRLFLLGFVSSILAVIVYLISFPILYLIGEHSNKFLVKQAIDIIGVLLGLFIVLFELIYKMVIYKNLKEIKKDIVFQESSRWTKLKYVLVGIVGIALFFGIVAGLIMIPSKKAANRAKDARIAADMSQTRSVAALLYAEEGNYKGLSCSYNAEMKAICGDIKNQAGLEPVIYASEGAYCGYIKLNSGKYFCIDSRAVAVETNINPSLKYCTGANFICPPR